MLGTTAVFLVATALSGDLSTAAQLSARPGLCGPRQALAGEAEASGAWDQVRDQAQQRTCRRLARAQLALATRPELALELAQELARDLPARPEPWVIQARAQTRRRAFADAWLLWEAAQQRGAELRSPRDLHDYAVCAALTEHAEAAVAGYRRLLPLLQAWPDPIDQQALEIEAAVAAMRRGPEGLEEAAGQLTAARTRASSTGLRAIAVGLSALWAARRGVAADAHRLDAPEVWHFVESVRAERWPAHWPVLPSYELFGAAALLIEAYSDTVAAELWQRHSAGLEQAAAPAPWRTLAAQRVERARAVRRSAP